MNKFDTDLKFQLYERSVQDPKSHIPWVENTYTDLFGRKPHHLREDFCGTFYFSSEWVKRHPKNSALCLDIDPKPLAYGKKNHYKSLSSGERKRIHILRQNVMSVTRPPSDVVYAGNFSFNIFKQWDTLVNYFGYAHRSLSKEGFFLLEVGGGPGFIEEGKETKRVRKNGKPWFTYIWEQKNFNPINHDGLYKIHFTMANGKTHRNAFVYDWRLWTLPEIRAALKEAGFKRSVVFWEEQDDDGNGADIFSLTEVGDNAHAWLAYVIALKS